MSHPTEPGILDSRALRTVFFVSDGTGVTVETLGHSLLSQFESLNFRNVIIPFVTTEIKAREAVERINAEAASSAITPVVFSSLVNEPIREIVAASEALVLDFFAAFLSRLEQAFGTGSSRAAGRAHGMGNSTGYLSRIDAVNFSLATDDGLQPDRYREAQVILVGLSRVGKTPTSLYLALQYGIFAANYPLAEDELDTDALPASLQPWRERLYGLTIDPAQLSRIRNERRPGTVYAEPARVRRDIRRAYDLLAANAIPVIDTTSISVEEIAATILYQRGLNPALP
ncbi:MAG: pyruvate, water dikinase regulatory protein [Gammaproteobacteria bacterium]